MENVINIVFICFNANFKRLQTNCTLLPVAEEHIINQLGYI